MASQKEPAEKPAELVRSSKGERTVESRCPKCGRVTSSSDGGQWGFVFSCTPCGVSWGSR